MPQITLTTELLTAALEGFEAQKNRIDARIEEIRRMLKFDRTEPVARSEAEKPKRKRSAAVRRRMKIAQQLRWKKVKQNVEPLQPAVSSETTKPKRKVSASARRKMALAQKARWAAVKEASEPQSAVAKETVNKEVRAKKAAAKRGVSAKGPKQTVKKVIAANAKAKKSPEPLAAKAAAE